MEDDEENTASPSTSSVQLPQMTTISRHTFGIPGPTSDAFSINIIENIEEEYGMFVWPCSVVLAEYVWQQRSRFSGKSVLELGAGTSLPGLVAAKVGSDVTLSDDSSRLETCCYMQSILRRFRLVKRETISQHLPCIACNNGSFVTGQLIVVQQVLSTVIHQTCCYMQSILRRIRLVKAATMSQHLPCIACNNGRLVTGQLIVVQQVLSTSSYKLPINEIDGNG